MNNTIKKFKKILRKVLSHREYMKGLSDVELAGMTQKFKMRLKSGEKLDSILPEAYAAVCEADRRILGKMPFDVQIIGAIALHKGYLAEMNTGEGKTLVATMPLYLNALTEKSAMLVTTNEYLALRDSDEMGKVYKFMGLTVAAAVMRDTDKQFTNEQKKQIYSADIVYTTHAILGFDYLLNNLITVASERFLREFNFIIIDEADSVLLDSAQTPLVISGSPRVQSNLYAMADFFVTTLKEGDDYEKEENKVWLTEKGIKYAESYFQIDNFYGEEHFEINRHVILALRAHAVFELEKEYMVSEKNEIQLLDSGSGRMMQGVKLRGGQHQALEQKEKLKLSQENRSVASITYQNLFLLFPNMSGMSGTISDAEAELRNVYGKRVVVIPPNRPVKRYDMKDIYFKTADEQFRAAIDFVCKIHASEQPVLVVTSTIAETEMISKLLLDRKIPHSVLNANNAFWEAEIIKEAGQRNAVTVSTAMAGRGTDIKLGAGVKGLGGLAVVGVGRMDNIRQERQARGRSGRQGDPGFSIFFVSLEDEIVAKNGSSKVEKYIRKKGGRRSKIKRYINSAQSICEEYAVMSRQKAMDYDVVLQRQRAIIYSTRNQLLDGNGLGEDTFFEIAKKNIEDFLTSRKDYKTEVSGYILENISYNLDDKLAAAVQGKASDLKEYLLERTRVCFKEQRNRLSSDANMDSFVRMVTLKAIDDAWVEQVDFLQQLQSAVAGRASAQRNSVYEYEKESLESFGKMEKMIYKDIMRNILLSIIYEDEDNELHIILP